MGKHILQIGLTQAAPLPATMDFSLQAPDFLGTWNWRSRARGESVAAWAARVEAQEAEVKRRAAAWLLKGQKVRVNHDPFPLGHSLTDRIGVIHGRCRQCFSDYVYVRFEPAEGETESKVRMLGLECLAPID